MILFEWEWLQYDFHKTVQDPSNGEFVHQYFKQNRPDLLQFIKRKANNRGSEQSKRYSGKQAGASAAAAASHNAAASSVMDFPMQQIQDLETLDSLDMSGAGEVLSGAGFESTSELAHRLNKVEEENRMLKKMFMDSHQKNLLMQDRMEKVLKTIYGVFVGQPGAGKTLSGRLPSLLLENIPSFAPPPRGLLMDEPHIASTSPQITELAADAELGPTVFRGTSFDAAAAAVAGLAPSSGGELRYLPSFDAMVMAAPLSGEPLVRSHAIASEDGDFMSDRVTQLPDENSFHSAAIPISAEGFAARAPSPQSSTFASSLSSAKPFHSLGLLPQSSAPSGAEEADPSWTAAAASKRRSLSVAPEDADMGKDWESSLPSKKPRPHTTDMPPPNASSSTEDTLQNVDLAQADTRQFIDLLNRNQSVSILSSSPHSSPEGTRKGERECAISACF